MLKALWKIWRILRITIKITAYSCLVLSLIFSLAVAALNIHYIYFNKNDLPDIEPLIRFEEPATGQIYDSEGKVIIELAKEYRHIQPYNELPPVVKNAIFAAEDKRFYEHDGVDYQALSRAAFKNLFHSLRVMSKAYDKQFKLKPEVIFSQGASTLTQQLVRLCLLSDITAKEKKDLLISDNRKIRFVAKFIGVPKTNSLLRKREEVRLSLWLEKEMAKRYGSKRRAKEEILMRFASFVYLGSGRYGFAASSDFYFDKKIKDFTSNDADKAAFLAGLIKHPAPSNLTNIQKYLDRRNEVLVLMAQNGFISAEDKDRLINQPLELAKKNPLKTPSPTAVANILNEIKRAGFTVDDFFEGRFQIHSSNNLQIQSIATQALENGLKAYEERYPGLKGTVQGSVVILRNNDGAILAEVGGRQVYRSKQIAYTDFNRAENAHRQPGSSFKPFVYLTAFENGLTLDSVILDSPISVSMGSVKVGKKWVKRPLKWISNYDGKFKGAIPARKALAESRNAAAMRLTKSLGDGKITGIEKVVDTAHALGIRSLLHNPHERPYITTAIGATEVTLMELANAYRAMATGIYAEPHMVLKLTDRNGDIIYSAKDTAKTLPLDAGALALIQEGMRGVIRIPGGTGHSLDNTVRHRSPQEDFPIPVMGKTGTTNNFRDARFGGSTFGAGGITVAIWVGFDDFRELGSKETGGRTALPIFKEIMLNVYGKGLVGPVPQFPEEIERNIDNYLGKK